MSETVNRYRYTYIDPHGLPCSKDIYAESDYLANEEFWSDKRENYSIYKVEHLGTYKKADDDACQCGDDYPGRAVDGVDDGLDDDVMASRHDCEFGGEGDIVCSVGVGGGVRDTPDTTASTAIRNLFHRFFCKGGQT